MQMDFMDVRMDDKKPPYAVHKAVGEYAGDRGIRIKNPQTAVRVLNEMFHMKDFTEERVYLILMSDSCDVISFFGGWQRGAQLCAPRGTGNPAEGAAVQHGKAHCGA